MKYKDAIPQHNKEVMTDMKTRRVAVAVLACTIGCGSDERESEAFCPANCGVSGLDSCCEKRPVDGGDFFRDYDNANDQLYNIMSHPASITSFALDRYEVTVGRFRAFVDSGHGTQELPPAQDAGRRPNLARSGWHNEWNAMLPPNKEALVSMLNCDPGATWSDVETDRDNLPVNCVSWHVAMAFCVFEGGHLPTAAEWNYVATGGSEQRAYPWSTTSDITDISCEHTNYRDDSGECGLLGPVGQKPLGDGKWGHSDLAGNVNEWVIDLYPGFLEPIYVDPCVDCARVSVSSTAHRAIRGGDFSDVAVYQRVADWRVGDDPLARRVFTGFRCASND